MEIYIFGSRGPSNCFKLDSDIDVVVVEAAGGKSDDFQNLTSRFKQFALEHSTNRAGLDLFYLSDIAENPPILESVYDFGDRTISFADAQEFQDFRKTWKAITEADLMITVINAQNNSR